MKYSQQITCDNLGSSRGHNGDRGLGGRLASPIQLEPSHTLLETHHHKPVRSPTILSFTISHLDTHCYNPHYTITNQWDRSKQPLIVTHCQPEISNYDHIIPIITLHWLVTAKHISVITNHNKLIISQTILHHNKQITSQTILHRYIRPWGR